MLEIRPNCELCDCDLPPQAKNAMICSYECTYCEACARKTLANVCPKCGGGFQPRPIRTTTTWRAGLGLATHPASKTRVHTPFTSEEIAAHVARIRHLSPEAR